MYWYERIKLLTIILFISKSHFQYQSCYMNDLSSRMKNRFVHMKHTQPVFTECFFLFTWWNEFYRRHSMRSFLGNSVEGSQVHSLHRWETDVDIHKHKQGISFRFTQVQHSALKLSHVKVLNKKLFYRLISCFYALIIKCKRVLSASLFNST